MVPDISRGNRTIGLLFYLFGPGRRDEHVDPHIVASWDGFTPDPGRHPGATVQQLADALDLRVRQRERQGRGRPTDYVWHCPVRADPGDRALTDDEWATVARRIVAATGIAPDRDPHGCRWVAVRHDDNHIHIVATTVRANLALARNSYDYQRAQAECRKIEKDFGLRQLNTGDGTAAKRPTSAERAKAERAGTKLTPREQLRDAVRLAATGAANEREFFARLRRSGVLVKERTAPSGDITGYAVALVADRNKDAAPIWFSGSTLAGNLSLPKLRDRFAARPDGEKAPENLGRSSPNPPENAGFAHSGRPGGHRPPTPLSRAGRARQDAAEGLDQATEHLNATTNSPADASHRTLVIDSVRKAAAYAADIGEVIDAIAESEPSGTTRTDLKAAARAYERAARSRIHAATTIQRALRGAARDIISAGPVRPEDGGAVGTALSALVVAVIAAYRWHDAREHLQQAAAAREAADHLWAAYLRSGPVTVLRTSVLALSASDRRRHTRASLQALPVHMRKRVTDIGCDILVATLAEAELDGHDTRALLQQAVIQRELDTATDPAHVLAWRIRRLADLPGPSPRTRAQPAKATSGTTHQAPQFATLRGPRRRS
ncbi:relaxase/mobilization nuclease domain-containing protein [Yinghuangia sp. ASG 101]|uniref:relaxase/mobilization nuclease domain-containing protein n=1 Tax=Yinghuangia sp. ASG 101 TaxID=2896848 RepID=UPI001E30AD62|nr:relaxase/mobilization nuclease domain-containing protein [Yinghuangia sp. ASG 101]UGQ10964.1 relaxase/mobilization nuclease domain-containing protein [Yinghuangia sp. ASG 101]